MVSWPLENPFFEERSQPTIGAKLVGETLKLPCTCSVFVTIVQRFGVLASSLCRSTSKSRGVSWIPSVDCGIARKHSKGNWRDGFRFVGAFGRAETRFGMEERSAQGR